MRREPGMFCKSKAPRRLVARRRPDAATLAWNLLLVEGDATLIVPASRLKGSHLTNSLPSADGVAPLPHPS